MAPNRVLHFLVAFVILIIHKPVDCRVDVFLRKEEVNRLLGLDSEIYYVRDGQVNNYALQFNVPVAEAINTLNFFWLSRSEFPIYYSTAVLTNNKEALFPPKVSVGPRGTIPTKPEVFIVTLECTGLVTTEVQIHIQLNYTYPDERSPTMLTFQRKKTCIAKRFPTGTELFNFPAPVANLPKLANQDEDLDPILENVKKYLNADASKEETRNKFADERPNGLKNTPNSYAGVSVTTTNIFYIAIGCITGFIIIIAIMVSVYFLRTRTKSSSSSIQGRMDQRHYMSALASPAYAGQLQPFLRPDSPSTVSKFSAYTTTGMSNSVASCCRSQYSSATTAPSMFMAVAREVDVPVVLSDLNVDRAAIRFGELMLEGTFGEVFGGLLCDAATTREEQEDCATATVIDREILIKTVKNHTSQTQLQNFFEEGLMFYGVPPHRNLLQPFASSVTLDGGKVDPQIAFKQCARTAPLLAYPFPALGNLKKLLLRCRGAETGTLLQSFSTQDLVFMAVQIVQGMSHLHRHKIVHKDLATRNCWVDNNLRVLIGDTALSRDMFASDYHCLGDNENRPVKWLAIESLVAHQFTSASDVWSFGVTLWELLTLAQQPYTDVDPFEMADALRKGCRLKQPYNCPDELFGVTICCWAMNPDARPTFSQLQTALQDFYNALMSFV